MYNFPDSPTPGEVYTPPYGGQSYIWQPPRWLVMGIPPTGGGGSSGIEEAPVDSQQYGRQDAAWTVVDPGVSDWADITGKPATFPPTVPIPWTDVSGKPATFPPALPIPWTDVSGKPATFPPTLPIAKSDVTDLPVELTALHNRDAQLQTSIDDAVAVNVTQQTAINTNTATNATQDTAIAGKANAVHTHPQTDVTNLVADLASKAPLDSPTFTGDPKAPTPATSDNDTSIATTAYVKANLATIVVGASVSDTAPATPQQGQFWWNSANGNLYISYNDGSSTQWVQINTVGSL